MVIMDTLVPGHKHTGLLSLGMELIEERGKRINIKLSYLFIELTKPSQCTDIVRI